VHVSTNVFSSQLGNRDLEVDDGPKLIAKFSLVKQYILVLQHPINTSFAKRFFSRSQYYKLFFHTKLSLLMVRICV
jgi:hypothetical protein